MGNQPTEAHLFRYDGHLPCREVFFALSSVTLMFLGKILQDANTVESYSIEEKGFIVCMISKVENSKYLGNSNGTYNQGSQKQYHPLLVPLLLHQRFLHPHLPSR